MLDVRKPIGYLFVVVGAILAIYGLANPQITILSVIDSPTEYKLNLDLPWGIVMFLFGALMLWLEHYEQSRHQAIKS